MEEDGLYDVFVVDLNGVQAVPAVDDMAGTLQHLQQTVCVSDQQTTAGRVPLQTRYRRTAAPDTDNTNRLNR